MTESVGIEADGATRPLVLAIDAGTSSVRALVYDASGRKIRGWEEHRPYDLTTSEGGGVEAHADALLERTYSCLDAILHSMGPAAGELVAVACDTFWHSMIGIDAQGTARTPIYTWADTRSAQAADRLKLRLDAAAIHARTGAVLHASYWPAKLQWLHDDDPGLSERIAHWMSFGEYLYLRLFGERRVSISMASATGLLDQNTCDWDAELMSALPIRSDQLSPLGDIGDPLTGLRGEYATRWPALARLPWYLALGDGACNNVGSGGVDDTRAVVMIGTSGALRIVRRVERVEIPQGLWSYRIDRHRVVQGGAFSAGGNVFAWLTETMQLPEVAALERDLAAMKPDAHGLTVLPFLAGERSPGWNDDARAAMVGMSLHTAPIDILRAWLEAVAYRFGLVYDIMHRRIETVRAIIGSGTGLIHSPAWMQIMSDVLGQPLTASAVPEATSRGAALLVLQSLGHLGDLRDAPLPLGKQYAPEGTNTAVYRAAMDRQQRLYDRLLG